MRRKQRFVLLGILVGLFLSTGLSALALHAGKADWLFRVLRFTDVVWETPRAFEGFHFTCLGICVALAVVGGWIGSRIDKRNSDTIVFCFGVLFWILEAYKQFYSFYVLQDRVYDFGFFPLQFCSLPLYLCLLLPLLPTSRIKTALYHFLVLFETMGGCIVMGYPAFYDRLSLCIHTMLWHTLMILLGMILLVSHEYGKSWRHEVLPATPIFLLSLVLATLCNVLIYPFTANSPRPLNLYYLSPYGETTFMVVGDVRAACGWFPALLTYALLFVIVGAGLIFAAGYLIRILRLSVSRSRENEKVVKK